MTWKEMPSSVTLSTTNPTCTGALVVKLDLDSGYVLCCITTRVNTEIFSNLYKFIMDALHSPSVSTRSCGVPQSQM